MHGDRFEGWPAVDYDAALHLLDRQIVDVDGRLAGKVDDVELTEEGDLLVPTGLLVGPPAVLPRFGRRLGPWLAERYAQVSIAHAAGRRPAVIDLTLVERVDSAVHLSAPREGLLRPREEPGVSPTRRRLAHLLGMRVSGGPRRAGVLDVRLSAEAHGSGHHAMDALIVGRGRPGVLLGYDRQQVDRPWLLNALISRLHADSRVVGRHDVEIDWERRHVRIAPGAAVRRLSDQAAG